MIPVNSRPNEQQHPEQSRPLDPQEQRRVVVTGAAVGNALNALFAYCGPNVLDSEDAYKMGYAPAEAPAPVQPVAVPMPAGVVQPLPIEYQGEPQAMAEVPAAPALPQNPLFNAVIEAPMPDITGNRDMWDLPA